MTNAVIPANTLEPPAYLNDVFGTESNIAERATVPTLSSEGKVWSINLNGEKTKINKQNDDGDIEPVQVLRVVIVDYSKSRGRTYYEGAYEPGRALAPLCWSDDNITPHPSIALPQHKRCDACPQAVKGSRITDQNKPTTACAQHKLIAVVPAYKLDHPALRLKLAITSVYDKNNSEQNEQGWFAFDQYLEFLRKNRVKHSAAVITKMKFDPSAPWPKILFATDRWLKPEEIPLVKEAMHKPEVKSLLVSSWAGAHTGVSDVKPILWHTPPTQIGGSNPVLSDEDMRVYNVGADKPIVSVSIAEPKPKAPEPKKVAKAPKEKETKPQTTGDGLKDLLNDWQE